MREGSKGNLKFVTTPKPKVQPAPQSAKYKNKSNTMSDYTIDLPSQIAVSMDIETKRNLINKIGMIKVHTHKMMMEKNEVDKLVDEVLQIIKENEKD